MQKTSKDKTERINSKIHLAMNTPMAKRKTMKRTKQKRKIIHIESWNVRKINEERAIKNLIKGINKYTCK